MAGPAQAAAPMAGLAQAPMAGLAQVPTAGPARALTAGSAQASTAGPVQVPATAREAPAKLTVASRSAGLPTARAAQANGAASTAAQGASPRPPMHAARRGASPAVARTPMVAADASLQRQATDARVLAALSGGALSEVAPGTSSVSFLARVPDSQAQQPPAATPLATPEVARDRDPAPPLDEDRLYDRIVQRLRRELLDDRERRGRSIGEGRW